MMKKEFENGRAVVAALFAVCVASAAIPQSLQAQATILTACYVPDVGVVYRIKAAGLPDECTETTHVEFSWNMEGPAGPQGETGPQGPVGPQGPQGEPSFANLTRVSNTFTINNEADRIQDRTVDCPVGLIVIAGSAFLDTGDPASIQFLGSRPTGDRLGWEARFEVDSNRFVVTVWAICI